MEKFTLRVAAKRQVTIPARLLELLNIGEGDMLEIVAESSSFKGRGMKLVPSSFFTPEMLKELEAREKELDKAGAIELKDLNQLTTKP